MRILLIYPNYNMAKSGGGKKSRSILNKFHAKLSEPPLSLYLLARLTPEKHSVEIINEKFQDIDFNKYYDLVGITMMTVDAVRGYEIADKFRSKGTKVVLGGWHPSALPGEAKQHADGVVLGEAEEIWPKIIKDLENDELKPFYKQKEPTDITKIPFPSGRRVQGFSIEGTAISSRGCPYKCKFCAVGNSIHSSKFRTRPINDVVNDIKKARQRIIVFYDSSLTIDLDYTKSLFKSLRGLNKKLVCQGNLHILAKDDELLKLSRDAGCVEWLVGFESVSQDSLNEANKKNKVSTYYKTIEKIQSYGMDVHGYFIFGFDHDTKNTFRETLDFVKKSKILSADFTILTPSPGSKLYDEFKKQGRINNSNWSQYDYLYNVNYTPKNFTKYELLEYFQSTYSEYLSTKELVKRFYHSIKRGVNFTKIYFFITLTISNFATKKVFSKIGNSSLKNIDK